MTVNPKPAPERQRDSKPTSLLAGAFSRATFLQLFYLVGATCLVGAWSLDSTREYIFDNLEYSRDGRAPIALLDTSDSVSASACIYLLEQGEASTYEQIIEELYRRPQVAFKCLESVEATLKPRADEAESQESLDSAVWSEDAVSAALNERGLIPDYILIASALTQRWTEDLILGADNTCQTASNTRRGLELAQIDPAYRLMSCAIGADSAEVRECCVEQMGGHDTFAEMLSHPERAPQHLVSYDYQALAGAAFPELPLASELIGKYYQSSPPELLPSMPDGERRDSAHDRFGKQQEDVQNWVVEVGCQLHFNQSSRDFIPNTFVPLIEAPKCAPTSPPWDGMHSAESWSETCLSLYSSRRKLGYSPREALCDSLATATAGRAINHTSRAVSSAVTDSRYIYARSESEMNLEGEANFGDRIYGFGKGQPTSKDDEGAENWTTDGANSPLGGP